MPRLTGRILAALAVLALAVPLAACGEDHEVTIAETEGIYLEIGDHVFYQVQISRQLNPHDAEDRSYLIGVPAEQRSLSESETWFAVFMRAINTGDESQPAASDWHIVDTTGEEFRPLTLGPDNIFAYRGAASIASRDTLPESNTIALNGPAGGSLLLFKLNEEALANRPLELITPAPDDASREFIFTLDV